MRALIIVSSLLASTVAFADQKQGAACAAGLPADAKTIYDAAAPEAAATKDLRGLIESKTRPLVMSGKLPRATAKDSAEAAGKCLQIARQ